MDFHVILILLIHIGVLVDHRKTSRHFLINKLVLNTIGDKPSYKPLIIWFTDTSTSCQTPSYLWLRYLQTWGRQNNICGCVGNWPLYEWWTLNVKLFETNLSVYHDERSVQLSPIRIPQLLLLLFYKVCILVVWTSLFPLTHRDWMTHICVGRLGHRWFR